MSECEGAQRERGAKEGCPARGTRAGLAEERESV
jgi:hypothetical protein